MFETMIHDQSNNDAVPNPLRGVVERIRFQSDDEQFQVVVISDERQLEHTVVVRDAPVRIGEQVIVKGQVSWRRGEPQLEAEHVEWLRPTSRDEVEQYLLRAGLPGVGATRAKQIVAHFGDETLQVFEESPDRISEVPGIGAKTAKKIVEGWIAREGSRPVMLFLLGQGVTAGLARRIWDRYQHGTMAVLRDDPWKLAREVTGVGFLTADRLAQRLGRATDDPRRIAAGVFYALAEARDEGHVMVPDEPLVAWAARLVGAEPEVVREALHRLVASRALVTEPLPDGARAIYLHALFLEEEALAQALAALVTVVGVAPTVDLGALAEVEAALAFALDPGQREALLEVWGARLAVLTGGPGTGKTTIVRARTALALAQGQRVLLAAPTGRAARRLEESTGLAASTIHRLLEYAPREHRFQRDAQNPLEADLIVVDEASMLDQELALALVRAVPPGASLLLVGDVEQLPSVGAGDVLRDVISAGVVPVARLRRVFRQAARSRIVDVAHEMLEGRLLDGQRGAHGEFFFVPVDSPDAAVAMTCRLVAERFPETFGLDPRRDVQVLVPMHGGPVGTTALNAALQARLGQGGPTVSRGPVQFGAGDKVMQTRNNYELDTFNGDIGLVRHVDPETGRVVVDTGEREVTYDRESLDQLQPAWAVSVHKSQGSEFRAVVLVLMTHHFKLLQRNLVYTAVTRARERLVIVGNPTALRMAIENVVAGTRFTRLSARLQSRCAVH